MKTPQVLVFGDAMEDIALDSGSRFTSMPDGSLSLDVKQLGVKPGGSLAVAEQLRGVDWDHYSHALYNKNQPMPRRLHVDGLHVAGSHLQRLQVRLGGRHHRVPFHGSCHQAVLTALESGKYNAFGICDHDHTERAGEFVPALISHAIFNGLLPIVDPAPDVLVERYAHAGSIKPNRYEAPTLLGLPADWLVDSSSDLRPRALRVARDICWRGGIHECIITLDKNGCVYYRPGDDAQAWWFEGTENGVGSGDKVMAKLLSERARGRSTLSWLFPNPRGDEYHGPLTPDYTAYVNGCFDVLHPGHKKLLHFARTMNPTWRHVVVGLNTDASYRRLRGCDPQFDWGTRRDMVASVLSRTPHPDGPGYIAPGGWTILPLDEDDPSAQIRMIRPNVIVKGSDYKDRPMPEMDAINHVRATIEWFERDPAWGSTEMKEGWV